MYTRKLPIHKPITMPFTVRLTAKQPEQWTRYKADDCFSFHGAIMGAGSKLKAEPGDVVLDIRGGTLSARVATEQEEVSPGSGGLLRSKGLMDPELMAIFLSHTTVVKDLIREGQHTGSVVGSLRLRDLRDMQIAVPDPQTQVMLIKAHADSSVWLRAHVENMHKKTHILEQMADAITGEILQGKADRKQALMWVAQTMDPLKERFKRDKEVDYLTPEQIQQGPKDQRYVSEDQHQARINALTAQISELENKANPTEPEATTKSPRP